MEDSRLFLSHINDNYTLLRRKFAKYFSEKDMSFDDDMFQDCILKCYDAIERKGKLKDSTPYGIESYLFMSLKQNIKREGMYARNQKRDKNITSDSIVKIYEQWYNNNNDSVREKLLNDLYKDFATLYIMHVVENNFDAESYHLFKLKYLIPEMTYKKLIEKTHAKKVRQKVVEVRKWVQKNISKQQIKEAFSDVYGDLLIE